MNNQERWLLSDEQKGKLIASLIPELKILRTKANISQERIANILGISRQTYCQIETGRKVMPWGIYLSLLFFFDSMKDTSKLLMKLGVYPNDLIEQLNGGKQHGSLI